MDIDKANVCSLIVEDELTALEAIYPGYLNRRRVGDGSILIKLELPVNLSGPRRVVFIDDGTTSTSALTDPATFQDAPYLKLPSIPEATISHLPPLILDLRLPENYPLLSPPRILSAYFTHSWLPPNLLAVLLNRFHAFWVEQKTLGEGVLWRIVESIVTADFLEEPLRLIDVDGRLSICHAAPSLILHQLLSYDALMNDASFAATSFRCTICFEDRKGTACIRLACDHVFCQECLKDAWSFAVREGECSAVRCPDTGCVAKSSRRVKEEGGDGDGEAKEEDVGRVLTEREVVRWKWLRVQRDIARDPTVIHCPLQFCQSPVRAPKSHQPINAVELGPDGIGWQKLRICEACGFSFCIFCKKAWYALSFVSDDLSGYILRHGPITPCARNHTLSLVLEFLALPDDSHARRLMERNVGTGVLKKMVRQYLDDQKSREWLSKSTTQCPKCSVPCEKSEGCNHMTCARCSAHYCYRCGVQIDAEDPYKHFSTRGNCYGRLFDFEPIE